MTEIPPTIGPARLQKTSSGLRITIPVYQSWYRFLATPLWASLAVILIRQVDNLPPWWFLILCLTCMVPWARWIWRSAGRQVLTLNRVGLRVRYDLLGFGWNQDYFVQQIFKMRYSRFVSLTNREPSVATVPNYGWICFEYGQQSHRLVGRFSDVEARELVAVMESCSGTPLSAVSAKTVISQHAGRVSDETHRGAGALLLFSWIGGVPYCVVMFSESSALKLVAGSIWAAMVVVGIVGEVGYRYRFTTAGLEISSLGIRLKFIQVEKIIHYEPARWTPADGRNLPFLPSQRCFLWGGPGVRISTLDGSVYLGHKWPEKIVAELSQIKGLATRQDAGATLAAGAGDC